MQIIIGALSMGNLVFAVISLMLRDWGQKPAADRTPLITYLGLGYAAVMTVIHIILPNRITTNARRARARQVIRFDKGDPSADGLDAESFDLLGLYQNQLIRRAALIQGSAFFLLVAYIVEGQPIALLVAGLLLLRLLSMIPTQTRVERWLNEQRELLAEDRQSLG
jgi:hypothetical protein